MFESYHTQRVLSPEEFSFAVEMMEEHPWICRPLHRRGFDEMMDRLVLSKPERELLGELLGKFKYVDMDESEFLLRRIIDKLDEWGCTLSNTVFLATRNKASDNDGSVVFMKQLEDRLYGWKERNFINFFDERRHFPSGIKNYPNVVLVDDFIGSGETASLRLASLKAVLDKTKMKHKVFFVALAGMSEARSSYPELSSDNVFVPLWLDKAFPRGTDVARTQVMDAMLGRLSRNNNDGKRYSQDRYAYGYKDVAGLYYNVHYRVPNNVFSIFWWGRFKDMSVYHSMFRRA